MFGAGAVRMPARTVDLTRMAATFAAVGAESIPRGACAARPMRTPSGPTARPPDPLPPIRFANVSSRRGTLHAPSAGVNRAMLRLLVAAFAALLSMGCNEEPVPRADAATDAIVTPGLTRCGGEAVDLMTDDRNCGRCGAACSPGQRCQRGLCGSASPCSGTLELCGTDCSDLDRDADNCGACGRECGPELVCDRGECVAPCAPLEECDGSCVDLQASRAWTTVSPASVIALHAQDTRSVSTAAFGSTGTRTTRRMREPLPRRLRSWRV